MISYLQPFIPPVLTRSYYRKPELYFMPCQSAEEAWSYCGNGYEDLTIIDTIYQKTLIYWQQLEKDGPIRLDSGSCRMLNGLYQALEGECLSVLDFGGQLGSHYWIARRVVDPLISLYWTIIETPAIVEASRKLKTDVWFCSDLSEASKIQGEFDLVRTSGTLHFHRFPHQTLEKLTRLGAKYLHIHNTPLSDQPVYAVQYISMGSNGPGPAIKTTRKSHYPLFIPVQKSIEEILQKNYTILSFEDEGVMCDIGGNKIHAFGYFCRKK